MVHPAPNCSGTNVWGDGVDAAVAAVMALGDAATKNVGTAAGTVAAGDDSRFTGGDGGAPATVMVGAGIDPTGATDSTSAMQAKIDSAPPGTLVAIPGGTFKFSTLTVADGKNLSGGGWLSDAYIEGAFGDAGYATADFAGTVLRSTATSGNAITFDGLHLGPEGGTLGEFLLIGPGSGTSVGIQIGSAVNSVLSFHTRNVRVYNFATGVKMENVTTSTLDLSVKGCTLGVNLGTGVNNNAFQMLSVQHCTTGLTLASDCVGNAFTAPIAQANGTGFVVNGTFNTFYSPYCEGDTVFGFDFVGGHGNCIVGPLLAGGDVIRIQSGADLTQLLAFGTGWGGAGSVEDNGTNTFILGDTSYVTGTGTGRRYIDVANGMAVLPKLLDDTLTGFPLPYVTAGTRPSATGKIAGLSVYNASTAKPNITDGDGNWRDAAGTIV